MIPWICSRLGVRELVDRTGRETVFRLEPRVILDLVVRRRGMGCKSGDPTKGERAEGKENEDRGTREALVLHVFRRRVSRFRSV